MKLSSMCCTWVAALLPLTQAAMFRTAVQMPAAKIERLFSDIDKSVQKAGDDADLVFTSLYAYDQQLERSLRSEIVALNLTLANLNDMQAKYHDEINVYQMDLSQLNDKAQASREMASKLKVRTTKTHQELQNIANSARMLIDAMQGAVIAPEGKLVTLEEPDEHGEPARIYGAIRHMLAMDKAMRSGFKDVFEAFVPESLIQQGSEKGAEQMVAPIVHMTPELLRRTIAALKAVDIRTKNARANALAQLEAKQRRFEGDFLTAGATEDAQQGIEAEKERKAEEIVFSINFTKAILSLDVGFHKTVQLHIQKKEGMVDSIRVYRADQKKTLRDLVDLLAGNYSVSTVSGDSFIETKSTKHPLKISTLQKQIEDTIKQRGDTHAILLRIHDMLEKNVPVETENVKFLMKRMSDVLRAAEDEQMKTDDARQRCKSQDFHAGQEANQLRANMLLMASARNHTLAAAKAAKSNLRGIVKKMTALEASPDEYTRFTGQAMKTLEEQDKDCKVVSVAIQKAEDVVGRIFADAPPILALMHELQQKISMQSEKQQAYRQEESAFKMTFLQYVQDYLQLLKERRAHYETSLSALEAYSGELADDSVSQSNSLEVSHDIDKESSELCDSIMRFYEARKQRRGELIGTLRNVLPKVPETLSTIMSSDDSDIALD